jgi:hypothetical protein
VSEAIYNSCSRARGTAQAGIARAPPSPASPRLSVACLRTALPGTRLFTHFYSPNMPIDVVPLTKADIPAAIDIIQCAFADDPYFKWVFDPAKVRYTPDLDTTTLPPSTHARKQGEANPGSIDERTTVQQAAKSRLAGSEVFVGD